ncbi:MAG TPA: CRTAC1 family protein [Phycisphaerales bacterium]|nr:CRTAC1 family protein [Phycisphaerales bacterium]HMP37647.1 CRTAC1 family protein [Phycisphaerales bacterium]
MGVGQFSAPDAASSEGRQGTCVRKAFVRATRCAAAGALLLAAGADAGGAGPEPPIQLQDVTEAAGVHFLHTPNTAMIPGFQDWVVSGVAIADFNRDGYPDIFWASGGGKSGEPLPDFLFINNGDGTFTDRAAEWGIAIVHGACGACAGDFDGDGWPDIYVTSFGNGTNNQGQVGKNILWRNNGDGTFTNVAIPAGVAFTGMTISSGYGCAFGDYDLDGNLDLAVASWVNSAVGNRLFRNNGNGTFTDVTATAITFPSPLWGFQPAFADMDGDGWPELLLAADFKTSCYFRNNGNGTFTNITQASGTGLDQNGMGQCIGDFNNDRRLDWYVTSIFSDNPLPSSGLGNMLYMNAGSPGVHSFVEVAQSAGVDDGGWGWGAAAVDLDHDTWLDIVTVNGRPGSPEHSLEQEYLFRNNGDGTFTEMALEAGLDFIGEGKASCVLDYDRDGAMDIAIGFNGNFSGVSSPGAPSKLYRNVGGSASGNWLHIVFETTHNPRIAPQGFGTRVEATIGGTTLIRYVDGGPNFLGTSEICAHFGLGQAPVIDTLVIRWPRGYVTTLHGVAVNQHLTIAAPALCDFNGDGVVDGGDLGLLLGAWGPLGTSANRKADVNNDGVVNGADLGILLGAWSS